ncbi:MAG: citrate lyase acyl carrier protein [Tissierellia bacterium]|nr:citrate lyase acyl carrier protein [Tissierellia bacterium]
MEKREIVRPARAGSVESNDLLVIISPADDLSIDISSEVSLQYGDDIKKVIEETLKKFGVEKAQIKIEDKGALDFTIRARVEAAILRGSK